MSSFLDRLSWGRTGKTNGGAFIDTMVYVILFQSFILAAPYVYRQMALVKTVGDAVWHVSLDIFILCLWLLAVFVLHGVLKKIYRWANT